MPRLKARPDWIEEPHVKDFMDSYVSTKSQRNTARQYYSVLSRWIEFLCARWGVEPRDIDYSKATVVRYGPKEYSFPIRNKVIHDFLGQILYPTSRQKAHKVLRVYFNWLVEHDVLSVNPVAKPDYGSKRRKKKPGLKVEEITQLIAAIRENAPIEVKAPLLVQFAGGLRIGEVCALRSRDIQQDNNGEWALAIRREALKGRSQGWVPLPEETGIVMNEYFKWRKSVTNDKRLTHLFVKSNGRPWKSNELNDHIRGIGILVPELRTVTSHDLRRGHATIMAENRVPADVERQILRQQNSQTGFGYVRTPLYQGEIRYEDVRRLLIVQLAKEVASRLGGTCDAKIN